jgi:3-oxoacyl-[acyl-carrier-protein] synthase-1
VIAKPERVFINASTSNSALGKQQYLPSSMFSSTKNGGMQRCSAPVGDHQVLYYAMQEQPSLNKTFEKMMGLLIEQVDLLLAQTALTPKQLNKTMLFIGSTSLDIGCIKPDSSQAIWLSQTDKIGQLLAEHYALHSLHFTFNTACTSGANALLYATNFIKQGKVDNVIVIGFEFFNQLSLNGFDSLDLISKTSVKPFSATRDGLILGEGIGAVLLSKHCTDYSQLEVLGGYSSCDDHSLTITEEEGTHIVEVIKQALQNASIVQNDVDLIKVHGTASIKSDLAECNALNKLFTQLPKSYGFKSLIGHTLGACGVIELALFDHCIRHAYLPQLTYQEDKSAPLLLPFIESAAELIQSKIMLFNHFGFGGNNAALIVKKVEPS